MLDSRGMVRAWPGHLTPSKIPRGSEAAELLQGWVQGPGRTEWLGREVWAQRRRPTAASDNEAAGAAGPSNHPSGPAQGPGALCLPCRERPRRGAGLLGRGGLQEGGAEPAPHRPCALRPAGRGGLTLFLGLSSDATPPLSSRRRAAPGQVGRAAPMEGGGGGLHPRRGTVSRQSHPPPVILVPAVHPARLLQASPVGTCCCGGGMPGGHVPQVQMG